MIKFFSMITLTLPHKY